MRKSASPYQNPQLMSLVRVSAMDLVTHISEQNVKITNQFGTANLVAWADLGHTSPTAACVHQPISESAADVAGQSECNGPGYPYFGTECQNYEPIWHCEFSCLGRPGPSQPQLARRLRKSASPYQNPRLMLLVRVGAMDLGTHISEQNVKITNQFGTVNLVAWADLSQTSQTAA